MWKVSLICLCAITVGFVPVTGDVSEAMKKFMSAIQECAAKHQVEEVHMEKLKRNELPDDMAAKCMLACAYKTVGMMDDKGMLSPEQMIAQVMAYFPGDTEKMEKSRMFIEKCRHVNDGPVSDGENGCDRAGQIYKCTIDNAEQFTMAG